MTREQEAGRQPHSTPAQGARVFEGGVQETVEVLPRVDALSPGQREEGVIARVGRERIERRVHEGPAPAPGGAMPFDPERDALMAAHYTISSYYALAIAALLFVIAVGWVVVSNRGF